jgi:hypothetical protein
MWGLRWRHSYVWERGGKIVTFQQMPFAVSMKEQHPISIFFLLNAVYIFCPVNFVLFSSLDYVYQQNDCNVFPVLLLEPVFDLQTCRLSELYTKSLSTLNANDLIFVLYLSIVVFISRYLLKPALSNYVNLFFANLSIKGDMIDWCFN